MLPSNGASSVVPAYDFVNNKVRFYTASATPGATTNLVEAVGATPVGTFRTLIRVKGGAVTGPAT